MIPAMIVPVLTRPELLFRMLSTIDYPIQQVIIIDNGQVAGVVGTSSRIMEQIDVIRMPANLGVAGSWNLGIKAAPFAPWWLIANFDVTWPAGSLRAFADAMRIPRGVLLSAASPPWSAFAITESAVQTVGLFDERFHPAYFEDNDYERRCAHAGIVVEAAPIPVDHDNSSTLYSRSSFVERNQATFTDNATFHQAKVEHADTTSGWDLSRRRRLSWD